jgi:hypothetical protein
MADGRQTVPQKALAAFAQRDYTFAERNTTFRKDSAPVIMPVLLAGLFVALVGFAGVLRDRLQDINERRARPELPELRPRVG